MVNELIEISNDICKCDDCIDHVKTATHEMPDIVPATANIAPVLYNMKFLSSLLCCTPKHGPIYRATKGMDSIQLQKFVNELRSCTRDGKLHTEMELAFANRLTELRNL